MGAGEFFRRIPIPICGLALGATSLDRFLWYTFPDVYAFNVFALISFAIVMLFTARIVTDHKGILKDIETPALFGVLPTYTMTLMLLSAYVSDHAGGIAGDAAFLVWIGAVAASFVIMAFFVKRAFFGFSMDKVLPSWVIVFVGYVVAAATSSSFGTEDIGRILFWSGFIGYFVMLPLLLYRTLIFRKIPAPLVPTLAIFAAPVNLCIVGCLTVYGGIPDGPAGIALTVLTVMGVASYAAVIGYLPVMLNRKFSPSFAAMTFPLVISASSFYKLAEAHSIADNGIMPILLYVTLAIAVLIVAYVLIRYIMFLTAAAKGTP
ncbi:MAG: TDT family transporter [Methanomassiliicoccaceae archaeon]|nr:TDT family transporter [Methanomassiliicoccaceae archaeon]